LVEEAGAIVVGELAPLLASVEDRGIVGAEETAICWRWEPV